MTDIKDTAYMEMAYALAEKARGWTSPNPYVGAVLVKGGKIIAVGYHTRRGQPHAEALALQKAGGKARGATAYITLEPCIHWGYTPPCVERILESGVKRVVVSALDPNPRVYKKGIARLRRAGLDVKVGLLAEKDKILNEVYRKYITRQIPFVVVKAALSWDGKTATRSLSSKWISSAPTRRYIHLLRGEFDAIMVGIETILRDDPRLTVRHPSWKGKTITRVIMDSNLRFPLNARMLSTSTQGKLLIFTGPEAPDLKIRRLRDIGASVIKCARSESGIDPNEVLVHLGQREISSLFLEGGGTLQTTFLENGLADKILMTYSPKLVGGKKAPVFFTGKGADHIRDALRIKRIRTFKIADDIIAEGYL